MKYIALAITALAHAFLLGIGSGSESPQWLWNGIAFGVVWATAEAVGLYTRTNA